MIISEGRGLLRRQRYGGRPAGADRTLETERRERLGDRAHRTRDLAANGVERQPVARGELDAGHVGVRGVQRCEGRGIVGKQVLAEVGVPAEGLIGALAGEHDDVGAGTVRMAFLVGADRELRDV